jgi:hypothetical protein
VVGSASQARAMSSLPVVNLGVGQGAVRRPRLRRYVDEGERDALARQHDFIPQPAGVDLRLARDGFDPADAGARRRG